MNTKISGIYILTNPEGKSYIGQSVNIYERHQMYKQLNPDSVGPKLLNSLREYGYSNHVFSILEECEISMLDEKEYFYKHKFIEENGWDNSLFCRLRDKRGGKHSEDTLIKMRNAKLGKKYSEHSKQKMRKPKPEGFGDILSQSKTGKPNFKNRKQIAQYDMNGNLLKIWDHISKAERDLNLWNGGISACLNGRQKECGGFIWKLYN
jgi:group I intron endonuclease